MEALTLWLVFESDAYFYTRIGFIGFFHFKHFSTFFFLSMFGLTTLFKYIRKTLLSSRNFLSPLKFSSVIFISPFSLSIVEQT